MRTGLIDKKGHYLRGLRRLRRDHELKRYGEDGHIRTHIAYVARAGANTLPVGAQPVNLKRGEQAWISNEPD